MDASRPKPARRRRWFRRGNRRVRLTGAPLFPSGNGLGKRLRDAFSRAHLRRPLVAVLIAVVIGGGGFGLFRFLTRSRHFAIVDVAFSPLEHAQPSLLRARAGVAIGANLFSVDLATVERRVASDPWVRRAHARRQLPATLYIDVEERRPAVVASLGGLYLVDSDGEVFRRADSTDVGDLPIVTGLSRDEYSADPERARARFLDAITVAKAWASSTSRPALGEIHIERGGAVTVYTATGVGVRLGRALDGAADGSDILGERLARFDRVYQALTASGERPRFIYVDNRARPDRVTVKLAGRS